MPDLLDLVSSMPDLLDLVRYARDAGWEMVRDDMRLLSGPWVWVYDLD